MNETAGDVVIREGIGNMDFMRITEMLSKAFWSEGIGEAEVVNGAKNSALVVGTFLNGVQIGYARVISDKTRFAYILDVYVDEAYRNSGSGKKMMEYILEHKELKPVYQWYLVTSRAHGLYRKYGFAPAESPENILVMKRPKLMYCKGGI